MLVFGLDLGTKNIVLSYRDDGKLRFRKEINGYFAIPNDTGFAKNMLINSGVPYVEIPDRNDPEKKKFIALGSKAEEIAYAFNKTLKRPMSDGVLSRGDEDSVEMMAIIVQSLINEIKEDAILYYCVPAPALNMKINTEFHARIAQMIINGYESKGGNKIKGKPINEAQALVFSNIPDKTGVAISFGAGMINVCYCLFGIPIYSFSIVGSGDKIDESSAIQFGYDPEHPERDYRQTPTTMCRIKEKMSLKQVPTIPTERAIYINYGIMMDNVIKGIIDGFNQNVDKARIAKPIPIVISGGTSSPEGFIELFKEQMNKLKPPFEISEIRNSTNPLLSVAEGCLLAAEMDQGQK